MARDRNGKREMGQSRTFSKKKLTAFVTQAHSRGEARGGEQSARIHWYWSLDYNSSIRGLNNSDVMSKYHLVCQTDACNPPYHVLFLGCLCFKSRYLGWGEAIARYCQQISRYQDIMIYSCLHLSSQVMDDSVLIYIRGLAHINMINTLHSARWFIF